MKKRSVRIHGHDTSLTLEDEFWTALKTMACSQGKSVNSLIGEIDQQGHANLSSAVRVFILQHYMFGTGETCNKPTAKSREESL